MLRAFPKKMERNMTEKTLEALTDEEWEMIKTIRENREDDGFRLLNQQGSSPGSAGEAAKV
jgi:hypothetical protein